MSKIAPRLAAVGFAALIAATIGTAPLAQAQNSSGQQSQSQATAADYSDAKLESFAVAAVEVSKILREWGPKVKQAQDAGNQEEAQKLASEVRGKAKNVIKSTDGITMAEYNEIAQAARQNKELNKKVTDMVRARQEQGGASN